MPHWIFQHTSGDDALWAVPVIRLLYRARLELKLCKATKEEYTRRKQGGSVWLFSDSKSRRVLREVEHIRLSIKGLASFLFRWGCQAFPFLYWRRTNWRIAFRMLTVLLRVAILIFESVSISLWQMWIPGPVRMAKDQIQRFSRPWKWIKQIQFRSRSIAHHFELNWLLLPDYTGYRRYILPYFVLNIWHMVDVDISSDRNLRSCHPCCPRFGSVRCKVRPRGREVSERLPPRPCCRATTDNTLHHVSPQPTTNHISQPMQFLHLLHFAKMNSSRAAYRYRTMFTTRAGE